MRLKYKFIWIIIFLIGLILRSSFVLHPVDTLSWRENDVATIAKNYYENNMDFFYPQVNWGGKGPDYAEMEFPVYPYLIALSYKLFGFHDIAGRIISLIFSLATLLVFFRLSKYLFEERTAIVISLFFAISPLLNIISDTIQPESVMFFFYVSSVYTFIRWLNNPNIKYFILVSFCTAFALLSKITAAHIGILFFVLILIQKKWRFFFKPSIILFGIISVIPSILWYNYSHHFYTQYGNSLGLSNEYAWIGTDFFTDPYFITGIIKNDLHFIWMITGPVIILLALFFSKIFKDENVKFAFYWLLAVYVFYIIACRTTADSWAYYYHLFSAPAAAILLGSSIVALFDKFIKNKAENAKMPLFLSRTLIPLLVICLIVFQLFYNFRSIIRNKPVAFRTSEYYSSIDKLSKIIPENSIILASGGICADEKGYPVAYNSSYFFYWLNKKGYNICVGEQSIENVKSFADKGAQYFIAEKSAINEKKGFEEELNQNFKAVFNENGIKVYKL